MRSNSTSVDGFLRRLLAAHVVSDPAAPVNFSVRIEEAAPGVSPLHTLFSGGGRVLVKDRSPGRVLHALLAHLASFAEARREGFLPLDATVVVRGDKAVLSAPLQPGTRAFEASLRRGGLRRVDHPTVHLDLADRALVIPEPPLDVDVAAWASPPDEAGAGGLEPTDENVGRYTLAGVALVDVEDVPGPRSRAAVVSAVASLAQRPATVDGSVLLSTARALAEQVPVATLVTWKPSQQEAEQIVDLLG